MEQGTHYVNLWKYGKHNKLNKVPALNNDCVGQQKQSNQRDLLNNKRSPF